MLLLDHRKNSPKYIAYSKRAISKRLTIMAMKHLSTELSYNEPNHIKMSNETDHNDSCFTSPQTPV